LNPRTLAGYELSRPAHSTGLCDLSVANLADYTPVCDAKQIFQACARHDSAAETLSSSESPDDNEGLSQGAWAVLLGHDRHAQTQRARSGRRLGINACNRYVI
jgi:hypothetical protein